MRFSTLFATAHTTIMLCCFQYPFDFHLLGVKFGH